MSRIVVAALALLLSSCAGTKHPPRSVPEGAKTVAMLPAHNASWDRPVVDGTWLDEHANLSGLPKRPKP